MISKIIRSKEVKNAGWIIGGKVTQMVLSLVVGVITARYLGPSNYGLINYATSYTVFFTAFCTLGINAVIIKNFVDYPGQEGETIGSAILLRAMSSFLSAIMIVGIVSIVDHDEPVTIAVSCLCSISLVFQVFDTINYWFQFRYKSKVSSLIQIVAYIIVSAYKIIILVLNKDVKWFAFAHSFDFLLIAIFLLIAYKRSGGQKLSFSFGKCKQLIGASYHYILSSMMVAIYSQTDKLMLKQMLDESEVGYYATATTICTMWVFVLQAIIDSMYPTIIRLFDVNIKEFNRKNKQLYAIVFYLSCFASLMICLLSNIVVNILYGAAFMNAVNPLRICTWYTAFSYLAVARNAWIVSNNKQKYLKYMYCGSAITNVILNYFLIPLYGASGAAIASLITQFFSCFVMPALIKEMRENTLLMIEAITLKGIF